MDADHYCDHGEEINSLVLIVWHNIINNNINNDLRVGFAISPIHTIEEDEILLSRYIVDSAELSAIIMVINSFQS